MGFAPAARKNGFATPVLASAAPAVQPQVRPHRAHATEKAGYTDETLEKLFKDFAPISLDDTNKLARMLKRVDNKYVLRREELFGLLSSLRDQFAILEIDGVKEFRYS